MRYQASTRNNAVVATWSGGLEPAEERLLACAESGALYHPGPPPPGRPMTDWGPDRTIRAAMLRHLLVEDEWKVHAKGLEIRRARISGPLDLEAATVRCPVWLENCYLDATELIALDSATAPLLAFLACHMPGLSAGTLTVTKGLMLSRSLLTGPLLLSDACIAGGLKCYGTRLTGSDSDGHALVASRVTVSGGVFLTDDQAQSGARPFTAGGGIVLDDGDVSGGLHGEGAHLDGHDHENFALVGYRLKVSGGLYLPRAQVSAGAIGLVDADVTGPLSMAGATISGTDRSGNSLIADAIKVSSGAYLGQEFSAGGAVSLLDAVITGQLSFRQATISGTNGDRYSLIADRATVSGGAWLDGGFTAAGAVRLSGASITGMLSCAGASLNGADQSGTSLAGDLMMVSGDAHFDQGFRAAGAVSLRSARIGGALSVMPKQLAGGPGPVALDATGTQIGNELRWEPAAPVTARVILADASAGGLQDSWTDADSGADRPNGYWPSADHGQLLLNGFTYGRFAGAGPAALERRLAWIGSHPRRSAIRAETVFAPQPYEHLVQVYQQVGLDAEARAVAIARRRDLRWYGDLGQLRQASNWLLDVTIRYGYETWRALRLLAALYVVVLAVFLAAQHQPALVVPAQSVTGLHPVPTARTCTKDYPCFYPAGYAIDTVIPLINIGQADNWRPNASAPWGWLVELVSWAGIALGWALATLIVAGYTGLARRVDNP
jgi:hypothetical protein